MIFYCGSITFNDDRKMITMMLIFTNRPIKVKEKGWMAKGKIYVYKDIGVKGSSLQMMIRSGRNVML